MTNTTTNTMTTTNATQGQATAENFKLWSRHAKTLDLDGLRYVIRDCEKAALAMNGWNEERELFYLDQSFTYLDELWRRKNDS